MADRRFQVEVRKVRQTLTSWTAGALRPLLPFLLLLGCTPALWAQALLDEETRGLLVNAVEVAAELDLYGARCRSDDSGRYTDDLNKELAGKFRMTVSDVKDDLFPEQSYRSVNERLQRDFLEKLKAAGSCKEAKQAGMPTRLQARYKVLMQEIEQLP
jgi:hypothetical protein